MKILETERLYLREMREPDLDILTHVLSDPEVMRYYPETLDQKGCQHWILRNLERYLKYGYGIWMAYKRKNDEFIGQIGLSPLEFNGIIEPAVVYILKTEYWGRGYACEGALGCIRYAFDRLKVSRVITAIRPENTRSLKTAQRAGMKHLGECSLAGFRHMVLGFEHVDENKIDN